MTLIIAAGNSEQFIQISDRRLTTNGVVKDDESNKAIILYCENARLAVGFTGLASVGTFNTKDWLLKALYESGPPDFTAENIIKRFTIRATEDFKEIKALKELAHIHKRLSIMFTGYLCHHEPPLGALALVSNFQNLYKNLIEPQALDNFECYFMEEDRPNNGEIALYHAIGITSPVSQADLKEIKELLEKRKPAKAISEKLVALVRRYSDNRLSESAIGKQINCIILPRDQTLGAEYEYHSDIVKREAYGPSHLMLFKKLYMALGDISYHPVSEKAGPLSGPKLKPKQPCWCGSGKKYRNCHGRAPIKEGMIRFEFKPDD